MTRTSPSNAFTEFDHALECAMAEQIGAGNTAKMDLVNRLMLGREVSIERMNFGSAGACANSFGITALEAFRAVNLYRSWAAGYLKIDWEKPASIIQAETAAGMRGADGLYTRLYSGYYFGPLAGVNERARANGGAA